MAEGRVCRPWRDEWGRALGQLSGGEVIVWLDSLPGGQMKSGLVIQGQPWQLGWMRALFVLFLLLGVSSGQLRVPTDGWTRLEEGEKESEGKRTLGVWQNEVETVKVGAGWVGELPELAVLLGFRPGVQEVDPAEWPIVAKVLDGERLGLQIKFPKDKNGDQRQHFWLFGKGGGVFLKVIERNGGAFRLDQWKVSGPVTDPEGLKKKELERVVKLLRNPPPPTITISPDLEPAAAEAIPAKEDRALTVVVREDGTFEVEGKELDLAALSEAMEKAVKEKPDGTLHIRAASAVQFKQVQRVIKAGAAAGIEKVAYASFAKEDDE